MRWIAILLAASSVGHAAQRFSDLTSPLPLPSGSTLIIGFLGGWEKWDNPMRAVRRLALDLRARDLPGAYVETVENHRRHLAIELVRRAYPDPSRARVILYGQSFGGAAVVKAARELDALGVPVLLTVQVDSVGRDDDLIPPNVAAAANFYQRDGIPIRGQASIRAAVPSRTLILANVERQYRDRDVDVSRDLWFRRAFGSSHIKMEWDAELWSQVERLIAEAAAR